MTTINQAITIYLEAEEQEMLDTLRKQGGVVWSRENMLHKCLKAEYERAMAEPKRAKPEKGVRLGVDQARDGAVGVTVGSGWCTPSLEFVAFPPASVKANRAQAIKDMVDVIDAATEGPIRAVITGYVKGGGTMKTKVG